MKRVILFAGVPLSLLCGSLLLAPRTSAITYGFVDSNNLGWSKFSHGQPTVIDRLDYDHR